MMVADEGVSERLDYLHERIYDIYQWWFDNAPGITPGESGTLAVLWSEVDFLTPLEEAS